MASFELDNLPDSNDLWKGIGGYFDSLGEILCEFIDNSISNFVGNNLPNRTICIQLKDMNSFVEVEVLDSGTGIKDLQSAFTLGSRKAAESPLNEHGFGFKHALASANIDNNSWSIDTCTSEDREKHQFKRITAPYLIQGQKVEIINNAWDSVVSTTGTKIKFTCTRELFKTISRGIRGQFSFSGIISILVEDLGFIYSGVLKDNGVHLIISELDSNGVEIQSITVKPIEPEWETYYPKLNSQEDIDLGAGKVHINYCFGNIYELTTTKKYYKKNMASSGAEIRINGRILAYNLFKEIWQKEPHPSYNQFLAVINITSDDAKRLPQTKTSKNGLREGDEKLAKLFEFIKSKLPEDKIPKNNDPRPEDVDELSLFEELKNLKEKQLSTIGNPTIITQCSSFNGLNEKIRMDMTVYINDKFIIYEGKKDSTKLLDIYQLRMYWDGYVFDNDRSPEQGILIASEHNDSVKSILPVINNMKDAKGNNYNIKLTTWRDEGINYPKLPTV